MIRLAARQFRASAVVAALGILAMTAVVLATRPGIVHMAAELHRTCGGRPGCGRPDGPLPVALGLVVIVVPALIGAFWGAPVVAREYEAGTHRLVWTQRISRTLWLAARLAVAGGVAVVTAGALSALVTWWAAPLDRVNASVYGTFDQRGIAPIGYAAFAFALGLTAGLLIRRTLPAMAVTLCGVLATRIVVTGWIRPLAFAPRTPDLALDPDNTGYGSSGNILLGIPKPSLEPAPPDIPNAWVESVRIVDRSGHPLTSDVLNATCPGIGHRAGSGSPPAGGHGPVPADAVRAMHDCVARLGATYHQAVTYQPGRRYWAFQWWELAVYLVATALLCAYAFVRLRRRA